MLNAGSRRELVSAINLQFSSNVRRIREHALGQVFLAILFRDGEDTGLSVAEITHQYTGITRNGYISEADASWVLRQLIQQQRVCSTGDEPRRYKLTTQTKIELAEGAREADRKIQSIVGSLFPTTMRNSGIYANAFLRVIARIAAEVGEEAAASLLRRSNLTPQDLRSLDLWLLDELQADSRLEREALRKGVIDFFRSSDPYSHELLWQITESYFVTRMLGLDPGGRALSQEMFSNWEFVVDTNVLVALLFEAHKNHDLVSATVRAIRSINRPLIVADCTVSEVESVKDRELGLLRDFIDRGDERWLEKTDSPFLRSYANSNVTEVADYIAGFADIPSLLAHRFGMRIVEIGSRGDDHKIEELASEIKGRSRRFGWDQGGKTDEVAIHDARILKYTFDRRQHSALQIWTLTLDGTLLDTRLDSDESSPLAIQPRSVIQWLAPVVNSDRITKDFPRVFSEMIADRFLPPEPFIDAGDLSLLLSTAEVRSLPDQDIERVISKVRAESIHLDPSTYKGQADLGSIIASVVSDPYSDTQTELLRTRRESELRADELQREKREREKREKELGELKAELDLEKQRSRDSSSEAEAAKIAGLTTEATWRFRLGWFAYIVIGLVAIVGWWYVADEVYSFAGIIVVPVLQLVGLQFIRSRWFRIFLGDYVQYLDDGSKKFVDG